MQNNLYLIIFYTLKINMSSNRLGRSMTDKSSEQGGGIKKSATLFAPNSK